MQAATPIRVPANSALQPASKSPYLLILTDEGSTNAHEPGNEDWLQRYHDYEATLAASGG